MYRDRPKLSPCLSDQRRRRKVITPCAMPGRLRVLHRTRDVISGGAKNERLAAEAGGQRLGGSSELFASSFVTIMCETAATQLVAFSPM